jgi:hypothetical protein
MRHAPTQLHRGSVRSAHRAPRAVPSQSVLLAVCLVFVPINRPVSGVMPSRHQYRLLLNTLPSFEDTRASVSIRSTLRECSYCRVKRKGW